MKTWNERKSLVKAFFFDIGNTLLDNKIIHRNESREVINEFLAIYGPAGKAEEYLPLTEETTRTIDRIQRERFGGVPPDKLDSQGAGEFYVREFCREFLRLAGKKPELTIVQRLSAAYLHGTATADSLFPGTKEVLTALKKDHRLGVITNNTIEFAEGPLRHHGLDSFFNVTIISGREGVGIVKPNPEIFLRALKRMNVEAGEAVMVGDSFEADVVGSHNVGMVPVWLNRDGQTDLPSGKYIVVNDIRKLTELTCLEYNKFKEGS